MRRLVLACVVAGLLALAGGSAASAESLSPRARAVVLIVAKPDLCGEVHSTVRKYGYEAALAGFELAFAEHPAYATPRVFRWVVKECRDE
jgi:hypothetical protein